MWSTPPSTASQASASDRSSAQPQQVGQPVQGQVAVPGNDAPASAPQPAREDLIASTSVEIYFQHKKEGTRPPRLYKSTVERSSCLQIILHQVNQKMDIAYPRGDPLRKAWSILGRKAERELIARCILECAFPRLNALTIWNSEMTQNLVDKTLLHMASTSPD